MSVIEVMLHCYRGTPPAYRVAMSYEGSASVSSSSSASAEGNAGSPAAAVAARDGLGFVTAGFVVAVAGVGVGGASMGGVAGGEGISLLRGSTTSLSLLVTLISDIVTKNWSC